MKHRSRVIHGSARGAAISIMLVAGLWGNTASAQMITKDPTNFMANMEQVSKSAVEYGKNAERWKSTAEHYQQQLIKLQRLNFGQAQKEDSFALRPLDYGMDDTCAGPGRGIKDQLIGAFKQMAPQLDGNVVNEQLAICQRMVYAENRRYNDSATMLKTLLQRSTEFAQIEQQRDGISGSQGALAANDNEAQRFVARNQLDLDYWQARMKAYDDYIAALKADHARLAKRALQGKKSGGDGFIPSSSLNSVFGH
ncbi:MULTISPECIES: hypothetical protein [unclassified Lysobacter]|uniref:hypothetical protein n=1 Tax=unclassified Lysobacter TaxID=2635362 RepID=UPI002035BD33|nr:MULTISPECIES: hypothetical protein [unclassified Lysobacter]